MNYFVSIGQCYGHSWQIDFLINSFKRLNLEKQLYIANSTEKFYNSSKFYDFNNIGKQKEYLKYNKWHTLYCLIKSKIINLPVVVLEPHTLIINEISEDYSKYNITFQVDSEFVYNNYKDDIVFNYNPEKSWLNFGDTIIFNNLEESFFEKILEKIEINSLYLKKLLNLDKISLLSTIFEYKQNLTINPTLDIECNLKQNDLKYILNYRDGFNDRFNKRFYNSSNISLIDKDIKTNLSSIRFTKSLDFFYNLIN